MSLYWFQLEEVSNYNYIESSEWDIMVPYLAQSSAYESEHDITIHAYFINNYSVVSNEFQMSGQIIQQYD